MPPETTAAPVPAGERILVADDDELMRDLLTTLFEVRGYAVQAYSSGTEALRALEESAPVTLILTDLQMPGLESMALVTALRQAAPEPLLIGMSASHPSPEVQRCLDAFLPKPFDMARFDTALEAARASRTRLPQAETPPAPPEPEVPAQEVAPAEGAVPVLDEAIVTALGKTLQARQLRELYLLTLNDVLRRVARMRGYAAAGDLSALQAEAHAVKGSCGMVGARELHLMATTLEGGTTLNTQVLEDFPAACDRLRRMLDEKFPQH